MFGRFRTSAAFILAGSIVTAAQLPRAPADLGWIGLYNDQLIEWLENARGSLLLMAAPGRGMQFFYVPAAGGAPHAFTPDLNLDDWGYGPYYHETFLERRGDWFLLPEDPFPADTWLNASELGDEPHVLTVGRIVSSTRGNLVVLALDRETLRARPEQPADMWCEGGAPPPLQPWTEVRIPRGDLYSRTGHLLIAPAHMKGC